MQQHSGMNLIKIVLELLQAARRTDGWTGITKLIEQILQLNLADASEK